MLIVAFSIRYDSFFFFILFAFLYFLKFYNEHALLLQKKKEKQVFSAGTVEVDQF